jgi:hypothetical protein
VQGEHQSAWRSPSRSRWLVHLGLLLSGAASIGTLQLLHIRVAYHADIGLLFVGLVSVHLLQRRRTLGRLASQLLSVRKLADRRTRLAVSDLLLILIVFNILLSGILDWRHGMPLQVPLPIPLDRWHADSAVALVIYLLVHVWRRRKRLWRSTIR